MSDEPPAPATPPAAHGVVDLGFLDHYLSIEVTRKQAVEKLTRDPVTLASVVRAGASLEASTPHETEPVASLESAHVPDVVPERPEPRTHARTRAPLRRDRREEIVEHLRSGPASAQELAELFSISREGVLRWLRQLETDGRVHSTAQARTSRTNRWVLTEAPDVTAEPDA